MHASRVAWTAVANKRYGASVALKVILERAGRQLLLLPAILALKDETKHLCIFFPQFKHPKTPVPDSLLALVKSNSGFNS